MLSTMHITACSMHTCYFPSLIAIVFRCLFVDVVSFLSLSSHCVGTPRASTNPHSRSVAATAATRRTTSRTLAPSTSTRPPRTTRSRATHRHTCVNSRPARRQRAAWRVAAAPTGMWRRNCVRCANSCRSTRWRTTTCCARMRCCGRR